MQRFKARLTYTPLIAVLAAALVCTLPFATNANAQGNRGGGRVIDAGTTINVRTTEAIKADSDDGRTFPGVVDEDILNRNRAVAIPKGSDVELVVTRLSDNEVSLDLESVTIRGERYSVDVEDSVVDSDRREGVGANERTGKYVGGGAVLGAIIGAIAGGGKGAAIGAGAGAAAGAGAQVLTRGKSVNVPAESLLTFRLSEPLRAGAAGRRGGAQDGRQNYRTDSRESQAYQEGLRNGRSDADRNLPRNSQSSSRSNNGQDRRDYENGYNDGYQAQSANRPGTSRPGAAANGFTVNIGRDNNVKWQGPPNAQVFVQVDNEPAKLFAAGQSGALAAPWISQGHTYVFTLRDAKGNEITRDQLDLRSTGGRGNRR